ncbi:hypothetical protein L210DRAFT_935610 [Boletus edulis BED1]|uniref:Uncharacterized protein n=1 Tax=Boletus edulis BED1 TaxID=1328754 RepID=A0AAD4G5V9_BOLED|nr:hypothetical protein L210DRAFT_935610 [Boletus edulis BED1]
MPKGLLTSTAHPTGIWSLGSLSPSSLAIPSASSSADMLDKVNDVVALGYTKKRTSTMGGAGVKVAVLDIISDGEPEMGSLLAFFPVPAFASLVVSAFTTGHHSGKYVVRVEKTPMISSVTVYRNFMSIQTLIPNFPDSESETPSTNGTCVKPRDMSQ